MTNFKLCFIILLTALHACIDKTKPIDKDFMFKKIFNTNKKTNFCQIDIFSDTEILLTYSFDFAIDGGCNIEKISFKNDSINIKNILHNDKDVISYINLNKDNIYLIKEDFIDNTLNSNIFINSKSSIDWKIINTPIKNPRKIIFSNVFVIEGNLNGTGQVFKSFDTGKSWEKVKYERGFKSLYLLNNTSFKDEVLCVVSKGYNNENCSLALLNTLNSSIQELISINKAEDYINPICRKKDMHIIKKDNKFELYKFNEQTLKKIETFEINIDFLEVKNIYIDEEIIIVSGIENKDSSKTLSWISKDKGDTWTPFNHSQEYNLIDTSNGDLYVKDKKNNILKGLYR